MSHLHLDKKLLNRIKRLQGQINAIENAIQQPDTSCMDVLQQTAAAKGAINGLMQELIEAHLKNHVFKDLSEINENELADFLKLLKRYT